MPPPEPSSPSLRVFRVADAHLRGAAGPMPARLYWPDPTEDRIPPPLLVLFHDGDGDGWDRFGRGLCAQVGAVVIAGSVRHLPDPQEGLTDDAWRVSEWAADHATELKADPERVVVAGEGRGCLFALAVACRARHEGWPPIARLVLIRPLLSPAPGAAWSDGAAPPTTVVEAEGGPGAARLRDAAVDVEVVPGDVPGDQLVVDLARSLRRAIPTAPRTRSVR